MIYMYKQNSINSNNNNLLFDWSEILHDISRLLTLRMKNSKEINQTQRNSTKF